MSLHILRTPLLAAPPLWVPRASGRPADLALNFRTNASYILGRQANLDDVLTCSRASVGFLDYASNEGGTYLPFDDNRIRRSNKGILIEESRTNSIRNSSVQGAQAGTPGTVPTNWDISFFPTGISSAIAATGTENGVDYVDITFSGTAGSNSNVGVIFEKSVSQVAATSSEVWTLSTFIKVVSGTPGNMFHVLRENNSSGSFTAYTNGSAFSVANSSANLGSSRNATSLTVAGATTAYIRPELGISFVSGNTYNFTIRIGWPQLEKGSFATSPIRTTNAALTRNADVVTLTLPARLQSRTAYTLFAQLIPNAPTTYGANQIAISIDDAVGANRLQLGRVASTGARTGLAIIGGSTVINTTTVVWSQSVRSKTAVVGANGDGAFYADGTQLATASGAAGTASFNTLRFSRYDGQLPWNGTIEQVAVWGSRISNPDLVRLTA